MPINQEQDHAQKEETNIKESENEAFAKSIEPGGSRSAIGVFSDRRREGDGGRRTPRCRGKLGAKIDGCGSQAQVNAWAEVRWPGLGLRACVW